MTEAPPDRHIYLSIAKIGPHRHYWVVWSVSYRDKDRPVIAHSDGFADVSEVAWRMGRIAARDAVARGIEEFTDLGSSRYARKAREFYQERHGRKSRAKTTNAQATRFVWRLHPGDGVGQPYFWTPHRIIRFPYRGLCLRNL
jgi:hypothetical protein